MNKVIIGLLLALSSARAEQHQKLTKNIIFNYTKIAHANYQDAYDGAQKLDQKISSFVNEAQSNKPNIEIISRQYNEMKNLWANQARLPYGQSEIFRFYNSPIDFEPIDDGHLSYLEKINFSGVEGLLNAWPLDEAYIDYVAGNSRSGVINDRSIPLTKIQITSMNERNGEKNISTGYHALEFLLWGQDQSEVQAGQRDYTDYLNKGTAKNQDRRRQYLTLTSKVMLTHLRKVVDQWKPATVNFRQEFETQNSKLSLEKIFKALIAMSGDELKSERIENSLLLEDQEEEHSCFSDKTINDIYTNAKGVMNIYLGEYKAFNSKLAINGPGLDMLVKSIDQNLDHEIKERLNQLMTSITLFYDHDNAGQPIIGQIKVPFDFAIIHRKSDIQAIIDNLDQLDQLLRKAAISLGLAIEI